MTHFNSRCEWRPTDDHIRDWLTAVAFGPLTDFAARPTRPGDIPGPGPYARIIPTTCEVVSIEPLDRRPSTELATREG